MKRPLVKKLDMKPGHRVWLLHKPDNYFDLLGELPDGIVLEEGVIEEEEVEEGNGVFDFIHYFSIHAAQLSGDLEMVLERLDVKGMLWISWPKKKSGFPTDINGNVIRQIVRPAGLIDVKVCSIDDFWSAAKFVWRKENR